MNLPHTSMAKLPVISLLFAFLTVGNAWGQELKEVTNTEGALTEQYTVFRKDKHQKHGSYTSFKYQKLWEKGQYDHGQRTGVWEFYNPKGEVEQQYDYDKKQVLFSKEYKERDTTQAQPLSTIIIDQDTSFVYLAKPPVPIGGSYQLTHLLMTSLRYPASAQRSNHRGQAIVAYKIDANGQFGHCKLLRSSSNPELDQEALRVVKLFGQFEWVPAQYNGRNVATILTHSVRFTNNP